jgi:hypothetical protein
MEVLKVIKLKKRKILFMEFNKIMSQKIFKLLKEKFEIIMKF